MIEWLPRASAAVESVAVPSGASARPARERHRERRHGLSGNEGSGVDRDGPASAAVGVHDSEVRVAREHRERNIASLFERFRANGAEPGSPRTSDLTRNAAARTRVGRRTASCLRFCSGRIGRPRRCRESFVPRVGRLRDHTVAALADQLAREVRSRPGLVLVRRARERDELFNPIDAAHGFARDTTRGSRCSAGQSSRRRGRVGHGREVCPRGTHLPYPSRRLAVAVAHDVHSKTILRTLEHRRFERRDDIRRGDRHRRSHAGWSSALCIDVQRLSRSGCNRIQGRPCTVPRQPDVPGERER